MFKNTNEYKAIKAELEKINALSKWAEFECYIDSVITFGYRVGSSYHQFNIICDDGFSKVIMIEDMLSLKRIVYFSHSIYHEQPRKPEELISEVSWSMHEYSGMN